MVAGGGDSGCNATNDPAGETEASDGLYDYFWKRPIAKRVPVKQLERVLELYRETYPDFNVRHFHEKLRSEHDIALSYTAG